MTRTSGGSTGKKTEGPIPLYGTCGGPAQGCLIPQRRSASTAACAVAHVLLCVLLGLLLSACGPAAPAQSPTSLPAPLSTPLPSPSPTTERRLAPTAIPSAVEPSPQPSAGASATLPIPTSTPARPFQPATPTEEAASPTLLNHARYTDSQGTVHVVGQVYNGTRSNLRWIKVVGTFLDERNELIVEKVSYAYIDVLRPEEKVPFSLSLWPSEVSRPISSYALTVSGSETDQEPFLGIQFAQHAATLTTSPIDGRLTLVIVGEVTNVGDQPASEVRVSCALYDAGGRVLDVGMTAALADVLEPGQVSPFKLYVSDLQGDPVNYHILAYGQRAADRVLQQRASLRIESPRGFSASLPYTDTLLARDSLGRLTITGEVENVDQARAVFVRVYAAFYDAADRLIDVDWTYAWRDALAPGERSPFQLDLFRARPAEVPDGQEIDHWQIWVEGTQVGDDVQPGEPLTLIDVQNAVSAQNLISLWGTVQNNGSETMAEIEVGVSVYDAERHLVAAGRTWLDEVLAPGEDTPFALDVQGAETAHSYKLFVQGVTH